MGATVPAGYYQKLAGYNEQAYDHNQNGAKRRDVLKSSLCPGISREVWGNQKNKKRGC